MIRKNFKNTDPLKSFGLWFSECQRKWNISIGNYESPMCSFTFVISRYRTAIWSNSIGDILSARQPSSQSFKGLLIPNCNNLKENYSCWGSGLSYIICPKYLDIYGFYCPQRSCGKVMFLHLSVILSTGECLADTYPWADTPLGRHPHWADTPLGHPLGRPPWQTPRGKTPPWTDTPRQTLPLSPAYGYCSGRYASYWNAFLYWFVCSM